MSTRFPYKMRLPVFCAPMFLVTGPELVIAACKAGIAGAFPTPNTRATAELDAWMSEITGALAPGDGPWAANLITHSTNARLADDLKLVEIGRSMGTPVVAKRGMVPQIGALGSLDWRW